MKTDTKARVRQIVHGHLGTSNEYTDDTSLADMKADSLDHVELSLAFEDEFKVSISDGEADANINPDSTIDTLTLFIDALIA